MVNPDDGHAYGQPVVALNPTSQGNLVVSAETGVAQTAALSSADRGKTWAANYPPLPASGPNTFTGSPWPAFDGSGKVYDSYLSADQAGNGQLVVSASSDGGASWGPATTIAGVSEQPDKNETAVDTTGGPYRGRVYVGYDSNPPSNLSSQPLMLGWSADGGATWSKTQLYDNGGDFGAAPVVGANGDVLVGWDDYCGGIVAGRCANTRGQLLIAKSTNGGASFAPPAQIATTTIGFGTTLNAYSTNAPSPPCPLPVSPGLSLAVDRSGGAHNGTLYAVWADRPFTDLPSPYPLQGPMHVYFSASVDGGALWTAAVQIDTANLNDGWEPALSVDPSTGAVSVAWYDRRDDSTNALYEVYYTQSTDGGLTFLPRQLRVAELPSSAALNCFGTGQTMGLTSENGTAHAVWTDTRNGFDQVFTATVSEVVAAQVKPSRGFITAAAITDTPSLLPAPPNGLTFIAGKFLGDGHLDLLGWGGNDSSLTVLAGNGDGTFRPPARTKPLTTGRVVWVASADLNRDGKPDLVFEGDDGFLRAALGNGDGTFQGPVALPMSAPGDPNRVVASIADLNGDGIPDLILTLRSSSNPAASTVFTWFGNGDGTFRAGPAQPLQGIANTVATADFNGDSATDLAVGYQQAGPSSLAILLGDGLGHFNQAATYDAGDNPSKILTPDINHDGRPDLAVVSTVSGTYDSQLVTLINSGGAGQALFNAPTHYPQPELPLELVTADFNHDGYADIAWFGSDPSFNTRKNELIMIMTGGASGALTVAATYDAPGFHGLLAADLAGDGRIDLIIGEAILHGRGDGTFQAAQRLEIGPSPLVSVATGDFNRDGKLDLAILAGTAVGSTQRPMGVSIALGNGDGTFQAATHYAISTTYDNPQGMAIADFNGDGILDIAVLFNQQVYVLLGNGDGTFKPPVSSPDGITWGLGAGIAVGEFDGDAVPDLVVAETSNSTPLAIHLLKGKGDGSFVVGNSYPVAGPIWSVRATDLNHDGKSDVVVSTQSYAQVFLGNGDGTLTPPSPLWQGGSALDIAFGDFNDDGKLDILFSTLQGIYIYPGNGDGTFPPTETTPASPYHGSSVAVGDFTGGGHLDAAMNAFPSSGRMLILRGNGDGTFLPELKYSASLAAFSAGDFNGDWQTDLVTVGPPTWGTDAEVLLANRIGASLAPASLAFGQQAIGTAAATQIVTLSNSGTGPMPVSLASIGGPSAVDFAKTADTCSGLQLLPGLSCTVTIGFKPVGPGIRSATLTVVDGGPGSPRQVPLSGSGAGAAISLTPPSLRFGNRLLGTGPTAAQTVSVTNSGNAPAHIGTIGKGGSNPGDFTLTGDICSGATVTGGGSCSFAVSFGPTAMGPRSATISVPDDAYGTPHTVAVAGAAVAGGPYTPLPPARILDTRVGPVPPGRSGGPLGPDQAMDVPISGQGGVPASGVTAVLLNVTVTNPTIQSALTIYPAGAQTRPIASNLNFVSGQTVANLAEVALGANGSVTVYNRSGATDVIFDVAGYVSSASASPGPSGFYNPLIPSRVLDTRIARAPFAANSTHRLQIAGWAGVPLSGADAVSLNVTVTGAPAGGYITAWPDGDGMPNTSNLNFNAGQTVQNRVIVKLPSNGVVDLYVGGGGSDVIVDIGGWFTDASRPDGTGGGLVGLTPARILDTRTGNGGFPIAPLQANSTMTVMVAGQGGVPSMSSPTPPRAAILNVTVTNTTAGSYLIVYPSDASQPLASDLNWSVGQTVPNLVVVKLSADGKIAIYNGYGSTDVIVDVLGYVT